MLAEEKPAQPLPDLPDRDLIDGVVDLLVELVPNHKLPKSELRHIAQHMIEEKKLTDADWAIDRMLESKKNLHRKRNLAQIRGYAPFSSLNKRVYEKLRTTFGEEMLEFMKDNLEDPEDIYAKWAYRFAMTAKEIGLDVCKEHQGNIYSFITSNPLWDGMREKAQESFMPWLQEGSPIREVSQDGEDASSEGSEGADETTEQES